MTRPALSVFSFALVAACASYASAQVYYSNDFDSPEYVAPGISASLTGGAAVSTIAPHDATYGNIYRNESNSTATELTLSSLPTHSGVDLDFLLVFLESWDSSDGGIYAPDSLDLYIDGTLVASYTYNNALGSIKDYDGGALLYEYTQFDGNSYYSDTVVDMSVDPALTFPHTGSTLTVGWIASGAGWQGGADEAYAIDNLSVTLSGVVVPEPTSMLLLLFGLALFVRYRR
jgi:hypothetical protein